MARKFKLNLNNSSQTYSDTLTENISTNDLSNPDNEDTQENFIFSDGMEKKSHGTSEVETNILKFSSNGNTPHDNAKTSENNAEASIETEAVSIQAVAISSPDVQKSHGTSTSKPECVIPSYKIEMIHREKIECSNLNFFSKRDIEELADLIRAFGLEQPLLLSDNKDGSYKVIGGERRYLATDIIYKESGQYEYLPAKIEYDTIQDEDEETIRIICSNSYRQLSDSEKFEAFTKLKQATERKLTSQEIGNKKVYYSKLLKLSETQIQRCINIENNLIPELQEEVLSGDLSIRQADELSRLPKEDQMTAATSESKKSRGTTNKKPKQINYIFNQERLGLIPDLLDDTKTLLTENRKFKDEEAAVKAEKILVKVNKELQQLNDLLENEAGAEDENSPAPDYSNPDE